MTHALASSRRARPAALHLVYFAVIVAGPLLLVIGALLWRSVSLERQQLDSRLGQVLEALVADLDRDFDRQFTILHTLESSPLLAAGNWPAFYEQARNALRHKGYVVLVDLDGRQIVNTYVPYGTAPETTGDPETIRRIREARRRVISNLFLSKVARQPVYNVSIPVPSSDDPRFIMSIGLLPKAVLAILKEQRLADGWSTVVWDGNGKLLAQLGMDDHAVGTPAPQALRALEPGKVTRVSMVSPGDVFAITARSDLSDWRVAVLFSAAAIESQVWTSIAVWGATILIAAAIVALLAWLFGRRLTGPLAAATDGARALGRGEELTLEPSGIVEIDAVNEALIRAKREVEASSAALRQSEEQLRSAAEAAEFGPHRYDVVNNRTYRSPQFLHILGAGEGEATASFAGGLDWVHPEDREVTATAKKAILAGHEDRYQLDYRILRRDGTVRWVMDRGRIARDAVTGRALEVVGVVLDITDMKDAEQRQRLLFEELNHRVKNTLAIVQSLAKQTLRSKPNPRDFTEAFDSRLLSLARAHDLLTHGSWSGAPLGDIARTAMEPFIGESRRIVIEGPAVAIPPSSTVALSLMFHELATNAAKYGALSAAGGTLTIEWQVAEGPAKSDVVLRWTEIDGPPVTAPLTTGFGSRLLEASARQVGGKVELTFAPTGLKCTIRFSVKRTMSAGPQLA